MMAKSEKLIRCESVISILRIPDERFYEWIDQSSIKIIKNKNNKKCISCEDFKTIANLDCRLSAEKEFFSWLSNSFQEDRKSGTNEKFKYLIDESENDFKHSITTLVKIHKKYSKHINFMSDRSPLAAAFILHAKSLTMLNMARLTYKNYYWNTFTLFRPIDESNDLAEYFMLPGSDEKLSKNIQKWFNEDLSPHNYECRNEISKFLGILLGEDEGGAYKESLSDLFFGESKSVHPSCNEVMYHLAEPFEKNGEVTFTFDYGPCSRYRNIFDLKFKFYSIIIDTAQSFLFCYRDRIPLLHKEDIIILEGLIKRINSV